MISNPSDEVQGRPGIATKQRSRCPDALSSRLQSDVPVF